MSILRIRTISDLPASLAARNRGKAVDDVGAVRATGLPEETDRLPAVATGSGTHADVAGEEGGFVMLPYPVGANRVWRQAKGRVIPNAKAETWKRVAAILVREAGIGFFESSVHVHYKLHPRMNKDGSASAIRLDIDAPAKALLDAFNGVVWHDDKQVMRLVGEVSHPVAGGGLSVRVTA